jgi:tRNA-splicing ligase RtcB
MFDTSHIRKLDDYRYLIPKETRSDMRTNAVVYANEKLLAAILKDLSLEQAVNVATLPGIVGDSLAMPDIHQGYGFPIGGVAATDYKTGVVSPGGVGFDINCGVRLLASPLKRGQVEPQVRDLVNQIFRDVPCGTGKESLLRLSHADLDRVLETGVQWMVEHEYGEPSDMEFCEERGQMRGADPDQVSKRAKERGRPQAGSLGSGNHFLEIQYVQEIVNPMAAEALGLEEDQIVVLIHTGSRGLGHQVCTDYVRLMDSRLASFRIHLPDRQLACAPASSPEGRQYLAAMAAAANFAWANRQAIADGVRRAVQTVLGQDAAERTRQVYDVAHNVAKVEVHGGMRVCVHRKGATRAFPLPGRRAAGLHSGLDGHRELRARRRGGLAGALVRDDVPRRRPAHVADGGAQADPRQRASARARVARHRHPLPVAQGPRRRSSVRVQGRRPRRRRRRARRARAARRPSRADRRREGMIRRAPSVGH